MKNWLLWACEQLSVKLFKIFPIFMKLFSKLSDTTKVKWIKSLGYNNWTIFTLSSTDCPGCEIGSVADELNCTHPCGFLASPNYPTLYPDSTTVTWNIQIPYDYYIRLEFIVFQIESSMPSCDEDYVDVYNIFGDGSRLLIGRYCLEYQPPAFLVANLNQMSVVFSSDGQFAKSGFFAQYSSERYKLPDYISGQIDMSGRYIQIRPWYQS